MSDMEAITRDEFFESLLGDFLDESGQLLERLNENLLQLDEWVRALENPGEHACDKGLLNEMFRAAHSLKGLSAMLGLKQINTLTHKIENVFDAARKEDMCINGDAVELMFRAIDRLVGLVEALKDPQSESVECESVIDDIQSLLQSAGVEKKQSTQEDAQKALNEIQHTTTETVAKPPAPATPSDIGKESTDVSAIPSPVSTPAAIPASSSSTAPNSAAATANVNSSGATTNVKSPSGKPKGKLTHEPVESLMGGLNDLFKNLRDENDPASKYLSIFIDETESSLDKFTDILLGSEKIPPSAVHEHLMVIAHRIKGSAASIGLNHAAKLAHVMEDVLQDLIELQGKLDSSVTDCLLACGDGMRHYVESLKRGHPETNTFSSLAQNLLSAYIKSQPGQKFVVAKTPSSLTNTEAVSGEPSGSETAATPTASSENIYKIDDVLRKQIWKMTAEENRVSTYVCAISFEDNLPLVGLKGRLIFEKACNFGSVVYFNPDPDSLEEREELPVVYFGLTTDKSPATVIRTLRIAGVKDIQYDPLMTQRESDASATINSNATDASHSASDADACETTANRASENAKSAESSGAVKTSLNEGSRPTETIRVDIERLDQLMNLAGQLVINKAQFSQIADRLKKSVSVSHSRNVLGEIDAGLAKFAGLETDAFDASVMKGELESLASAARRLQNDFESVRRDLDVLTHVRTSVNELYETIHLLDRVAEGIQRSVMDTRMLPIGPLFQRFKRVIRDLTRVNGKDIRMLINGEKTELDKRMIDELGDPLIHMVRNSVDHGIESPEVRREAGKPEQGTVSLNAFHRGNRIVIQVIDDGKGLDAERIKTKALERGLITESDAERMTRSQIYQLIWEPGLSTAEKITEVSGRGMGMDIVKSKIEELNGVIELDSEFGKGTTITIKLPLTLAILPSLMVSIDGDTFALPIESVSEIVRIGSKDLNTVHNQETACVRGRIISMVRLREIFAWHAAGKEAYEPEGDEVTLVIVGEQGREIGVAVDRVLGEQDIVIKSMAENFRNVLGIAGASILGDGRVSLILDIAALFNLVCHQKVET